MALQTPVKILPSTVNRTYLYAAATQLRDIYNTARANGTTAQFNRVLLDWVDDPFGKSDFQIVNEIGGGQFGAHTRIDLAFTYLTTAAQKVELQKVA